MPLSQAQFQKLVDKGYAPNQIVGFEKRRLSEGVEKKKASFSDAYRGINPITSLYDEARTFFEKDPKKKASLKATSKRRGEAARTEILGPIAHGASALAFDIPRTAMEIQVNRGVPGAKEAMELLYPEQTSGPGKATRFTSEAYGLFAGGPAKVAGNIYKTIAKKFGIEAAEQAMKGAGKVGLKAGVKQLGKKVVAGAGAGAGFTAATAEPTLEEYKEGVKRGAIYGGAFPIATQGIKLAARGTGKTLSSVGHWLSEQVGGVTKATRDTIDRLGAARVFDPIKNQADYIGQVVVPRARDKIKSVLNRFTKNVEDLAVKEFNFPKPVIQDIKSFGTKAIKKTAKAYGGTVQGVLTKVKVAMDGKEEAAHTAYRKAIGAFKGDAINSNAFYKATKNGLVKKGWITLRGEPTSRYKSGLNTTYDKLTDLFIDMGATTTAKGKKIAGHVLSKEDFSTYRDVLWDMLKERPSDILVNKIRSSLYAAAERSGMKGLNKARAAEKKIFAINEQFKNAQGQLKGVLSEPSLERFYKLPKAKVDQIVELEKHTGIKILGDIRKLNAHKYLNTMGQKLRNPKRLEGALHSTGDPKHSIVRDQFRKLLGNNLMDDLDAHFANQDFGLVTQRPGLGGGIYPSRSGLLRKGVAAGAKKYYKDIKPAVLRAKEKFIGQPTRKAKEFYAEPLALSKGGQRRLTTKRGSVARSDFSQAKGEPVFAGHKDITTKVLNRLEGRSKVSKQFISDLTKQEGLKQAERDVINTVLRDFGDDIPVKQFADKVKTQLLPLKYKTTEGKGKDDLRGFHESVALDDELRGPVESYSEHIYESPIKTKAGKIHFDTAKAEGYFAHTRIEDLPGKSRGKLLNIDHKSMPKGNTRRIIELQSDLFQRGRLEQERTIMGLTGGERVPISNIKHAIETKNWSKLKEFGWNTSQIKQAKTDPQRFISKITEREVNLPKLEPYKNNWHERIIREEIKQASIDGKKKLQFTTGKTAMQVEGLGTGGQNWLVFDKPGSFNARKVDPVKDLKVGKILTSGNPQDSDDIIDWVVQETLGEGKFKAARVDDVIEVMYDMGAIDDTIRGTHILMWPKKALKKLKDMATDATDYPGVSETFDISGKVDTSNPIFKFYEGPVKKYLNRLGMGVKTITDPRGVTWNQVKVPSSAKKKAVEAFAVAGAATAPALIAPKKAEAQTFGESGSKLLKGEKISTEASTYGWGEKGLKKNTASGKKFNSNDKIAAMWNVPLGTKVKVTDKKTGKSTTVEVSDRGPAKRLEKKRSIDLSKGAWKALGYNKPGLINVDLEIVGQRKPVFRSKK